MKAVRHHARDISQLNVRLSYISLDDVISLPSPRWAAAWSDKKQVLCEKPRGKGNEGGGVRSQSKN